MYTTAIYSDNLFLSRSDHAASVSSQRYESQPGCGETSTWVYFREPA